MPPAPDASARTRCAAAVRSHLKWLFDYAGGAALTHMMPGAGHVSGLTIGGAKGMLRGCFLALNRGWEAAVEG